MSGDLDDLLDEALGDLDTQQQERDAKLEQERRAHEDLAAQMMGEAGGAMPELHGADKELMEVLTKLMGQGFPGAPNAGAANGAGGGPSDADLGAIHQSLEKIIRDLEKDCQTDEDRAQLTQCNDLLQKLSTVDHTPHEPTEEEIAKLHEAIGQVMAHGGGLAGAGAPTTAGGGAANGAAAPPPPEELQRQMEELVKQMQQQQQTNAAEGGAERNGDAAESAGTDAMLQSMLREIMDPRVIAEPFRASLEAYPTWFERHGSSVSASDLDRFKQQQSKIAQLLAFIEAEHPDRGLDDNATPEERAALDKFVAYVEELQQLGQPPAQIHDIIVERAEAAKAK